MTTHAGTEPFSEIDAYTLGDAARRRGTGGVISRLKPQTAGTSFVGRALTARVLFEPHRDIPVAEYGAGKLLDQIKPGDVVVLDGGGVALTVWGDLATAILQARGGAAAVINAYVRDIEVIDPEFPLFATGVGIASVAGHGVVADVGQPIELEGIRIRTGDLIAGCAGGIVSVPWQDRIEVLEQCLTLLDTDRRVRNGISKGGAISELWHQHKSAL